MAADAIQYELERCVPALIDLEQKGIFGELECREIVRQRRRFEATVRGAEVVKKDFLDYISYETALETLRLTRAEQRGYTEKAVAASSGIPHIIRIFTRLCNHWPDDLLLWKQAVAFCTDAGATTALLKLLYRAIALHPRQALFWQLAAEREVQLGNVDGPRKLLLTALRHIPHSGSLWAQLLRFELSIAARLSAAVKDEDSKENLESRAVDELAEAAEDLPEAVAPGVGIEHCCVIFNTAAAKLSSQDEVVHFITAVYPTVFDLANSTLKLDKFMDFAAVFQEVILRTPPLHPLLLFLRFKLQALAAGRQEQDLLPFLDDLLRLLQDAAAAAPEISSPKRPKVQRSTTDVTGDAESTASALLSEYLTAVLCLLSNVVRAQPCAKVAKFLADFAAVEAAVTARHFPRYRGFLELALVYPAAVPETEAEDVVYFASRVSKLEISSSMPLPETQVPVVAKERALLDANLHKFAGGEGKEKEKGLGKGSEDGTEKGLDAMFETVTDPSQSQASHAVISPSAELVVDWILTKLIPVALSTGSVGLLRRTAAVVLEMTRFEALEHTVNRLRGIVNTFKPSATQRALTVYQSLEQAQIVAMLSTLIDGEKESQEERDRFLPSSVEEQLQFCRRERIRLPVECALNLAVLADVRMKGIDLSPEQVTQLSEQLLSIVPSAHVTSAVDKVFERCCQQSRFPHETLQRLMALWTSPDFALWLDSAARYPLIRYVCRRLVRALLADCVENPALAGLGARLQSAAETAGNAAVAAKDSEDLALAVEWATFASSVTQYSRYWKEDSEEGADSCDASPDDAGPWKLPASWQEALGPALLRDRVRARLLRRWEESELAVKEATRLLAELSP